MSTSLLITDALRARDTVAAWYNSATNSFVMSALKMDGTTSLYHYNYGPQRLFERSSVFASYGDDNSHITATVMQLASGGPKAGRELFVIAGHNNQLRARNTLRSGKIGALTAQVLPGTNSATYPYLIQTGDTARTVYLFYRELTPGTPNQWFRRFRTSTDGGVTWSAATTWLVSDDGGNEHRPYVFRAQDGPGSSRVDFITTRGHWNEVTDNALFHCYFTVDAAGARSWFKSDGTAIGTGDSALPLDNTDLTTIIGPTSGKQWQVQDFAWIGGVLTVLFSEMTPYDDATSHTYYRTRLVSGSWETPESIALAGESGTEPHQQYTDNWHNPGGGCLDPNDANSVYLSRKYGSGDFRLEKWTKSGTWAKVADISGNTGSMNLDPNWVRGAPTTQLLYVRGTITSDTDWDLDIYTYPSLPVRPAYPSTIAKPTTTGWIAGLKPEGTKFYIPLTENTGTTVADKVPGNAYGGTFTGSPTWASTSLGPALTTFSTGNYVVLGASPQPSGTAFPCWLAVIFSTTDTASGDIFSLGSSSSGTPWMRLIVNNAAAGNIGMHWRGSSGTGNGTNVAVSANDGNLHFFMTGYWSASEPAMFFDNAQIGAPAGTLSPLPTLNRMTIGAAGLNTYSSPMGANGKVVAVMGGEGDIPDPMELYEDLVAKGLFSAVRLAGRVGRMRNGNQLAMAGTRSGGNSL